MHHEINMRSSLECLIGWNRCATLATPCLFSENERGGVDNTVSQLHAMCSRSISTTWPAQLFITNLFLCRAVLHIMHNTDFVVYITSLVPSNLSRKFLNSKYNKVFGLILSGDLMVNICVESTA